MSDPSSGTPSKPSQADLDRYAAQFSQSRTLRLFGAHLSFPEGRRVVVSIPELRPEHRGGAGSASADMPVARMIVVFRVFPWWFVC